MDQISLINKKILVIEDDLSCLQLIRDQLKETGLEFYFAHNALRGLEVAQSIIPDLIILDVGLPDLDGFKLCKKIKTDKKLHETLIFILSGFHESKDRVRGLNLGADDYLVKPFHGEELKLRIKNLLKRKKSNNLKQIIKLNGITIDLDKAEIQIEGENIGLTFTEYKLLLLLIKNKNKIVSKEDLSIFILGYKENVESRTIDNHVYNIRKKLGSSAKRIKTVRSIGYLFEYDG
jgi:two-component system alkaline phosphatase synthesis response regulator PhoP